MRPKKLKEKVVVVTGASSGIGRATAEAFAQKGAAVVVTARQQDALDRLVEGLAAKGARVRAIAADVGDEAAVRRVAEKTLAEFGRIDVWVNNAAATLFGRFEELPMDEVRRIVDINLFGYIHGARAAIPIFREQGHGDLINVSSMVGHGASPYVSIYVTTKWAIEGLSESLREELLDAPHVHVSTVRAASIDTPLFQHAANHTGRPIKPLEPVYAPERVAKAIVRLAQHPRRVVYAGPAGRMMGIMHHIAPAIALRLEAKTVEKDHFQDGVAQETRGNLFEPDTRYNESSGGWEQSGESRKGGVAWVAGAGVLAAAVAIGITRISSRSRKESDRIERRRQEATWQMRGNGRIARRQERRRHREATERLREARRETQKRLG